MFRVAAFFRISLSLDIVDKGSSPAASTSYSRGTSP